MNEQTFHEGGATITVKYAGDDAFVSWTASDDPMALPALAARVKRFLVAEGVKVAHTSVSCADERAFLLAEAFGFTGWEIHMVMPLVGFEGTGRLTKSSEP